MSTLYASFRVKTVFYSFEKNSLSSTRNGFFVRNDLSLYPLQVLKNHHRFPATAVTPKWCEVLQVFSTHVYHTKIKIIQQSFNGHFT